MENQETKLKDMLDNLKKDDTSNDGSNLMSLRSQMEEREKSIAQMNARLIVLNDELKKAKSVEEKNEIRQRILALKSVIFMHQNAIHGAFA